MELTVMGAGVFGLSCALEALKRGARVRVIDPQGVGNGASGGVVGALAPHAPENWTAAKEMQLDALLSAGAFWASVEAAGGVSSGYGRSGRVQILPDARAVELSEIRSENAKTLWRGQASWRVRKADHPHDPISPTGLVAEDDLTARLNPIAAVQALKAAITALGGELRQSGTPIGETVIWATGAEGLRHLNLALGREIGGGEKGQGLRLAGGLPPDAPQIYAPGLHIVPHSDGTVGIGSTSERQYDDARRTDAQLDDLLARAIETVPALKGQTVLDRWAHERPRAATRKLVLGPWPKRPGHFVANGGFKTGFAMAPLAAAWVVDLAMEGRDQIPETFRLT